MRHNSMQVVHGSLTTKEIKMQLDSVDTIDKVMAIGLAICLTAIFYVLWGEREYL